MAAIYFPIIFPAIIFLSKAAVTISRNSEKRMTSKSDAYHAVKRGPMKFKGNKSLFKSDKLKKMKKLGKDDSTVVDPDIATHGGWRPLDNEIDLRGGINISIECDTTPGTYLAAMDNGRFTIGGPHLAGEGPNPEEILTLIKTPDDMLVSMKTGFGKYVGVDSEGNLIATADAVGTRERMIVVFEEGKTAIQSASNNLFLSMKPDREGYIRVTSRKAEADEMVKLRTDARKEGPVDWRSEEDRKSAAECETSYVKMYQHSKVATKGKYININLNDKESVRRAQQEGNLHELLLERRVKTKTGAICSKYYNRYSFK
ncbi:Protein FRG1 [Dirofilaria immitis]